jgi:hypothetical protein
MIENTSNVVTKRKFFIITFFNSWRIEKSETVFVSIKAVEVNSCINVIIIDVEVKYQIQNQLFNSFTSAVGKELVIG